MPPSLSVVALSASSDDLRLERATRSALRGRCERAVRGLAVRVNEGIVTLHGQTGSFYEKQLVLHAVQQVRGLAGIVDEVSVAGIY
jgi:osmotically-inducible protein OsmY